MKLVKATEKDSDRLIEYFSNTSLPGPVELKFRRQGSFFDQYRIQSDDFVTYILEDENTKEVSALATLIFRKGWIDNKEQSIGFATDLRVSTSRKAILQWSQYFLPAFEEERKKRNCQFVFSVVAHKQRQAYNAFIRPRSPKRQMPRYYLYKRFDIISLHGLFPFAPHPLPGIEVRTVKDSEQEALVEYVLKMKHKKHFYFHFNEEDFLKSIERWKGLSLDKFIVALDHLGNIIGCTCPWAVQNTQLIYPSNFEGMARSLQESLQLLSYFGLAHRLTKKDQAFSLRHLTHLYADNPDIFYSLLHFAFKHTHKNEFLVYSQFAGDLLTLPPKPFISSKVKAGLYSILPPDIAPPEFLKPTPFNVPPDFELAFL